MKQTRKLISNAPFTVNGKTARSTHGRFAFDLDGFTFDGGRGDIQVKAGDEPVFTERIHSHFARGVEVCSASAARAVTIQQFGKTRFGGGSVYDCTTIV